VLDDAVDDQSFSWTGLSIVEDNDVAPFLGERMATREQIVTLMSYVLGDKNRELLVASGLEAVPKDRRIAALRGLQDLGWIGHSGFADFEESYSLTREGRVVVQTKPPLTQFQPQVQEHISALRAMDCDDACARKEGLKRVIEIECKLGNWDSTLIYCYELSKLAWNIKDIEAAAYAAYYQGRVEEPQNKWDDALESYLRALELYMEAGDRKGVCTTNRALGIVYGNRGDHASAIRCLESSMSMARMIGDREAEAKAEANLAIIYDLEGKADLSENASRHCLSYFLETNDSVTVSRIANNLGVTNMSRERFDVAAEYFEKTIASCRQCGDREALGIALINGGYCCARLGDTRKALAYTDEAVSIFKEPNNLNMLAMAYRNYGRIEFKDGHTEHGMAWFERSIRASKASGVQDTIAACCYDYGMCLVESMADLRLAKRMLRIASEAYGRLGNTERANEIISRAAALVA